MSKIYITGHRNPDMDSICSAYAYSVLKNQTDPDNEYIPVRCGHMSPSVSSQMELLKIDIPSYMRNVEPKVGDVMLKVRRRLQADTPAYELIKYYDTDGPSVTPVFDGKNYRGLLSIDDITAWFLENHAEDYPTYDLIAGNVASVIRGRILKGNDKDVIHGCLMAGASDTEYFRKHIGDRPDSIVVMPYKEERIRSAFENDVPAVIISACEKPEELDIEFGDYRGLIFVTGLDTAETLRRVRMAPAVSTLMGPQGPAYSVSDLYEDVKNDLRESSFRGFSIMEDDEWKGYVTRRCFLRDPRYKVILVDHNEVSQSIPGIETAQVKEIIDHHRLDALKTDLPIFIDAEPLGSTCSIVYQLYGRQGIVPDPSTARVLLAGLLSDTVILKSPTTTEADRRYAEALSDICGEDIEEFGTRMFSLTESLSSMDPRTAICSDFKEYKEGGRRVGIGQFETTTLKDINEYSGTYLDALEEVRKGHGYDWAMLMITNVLNGKSVLLSTDYKSLKKMPYRRISEGVYDMPGVMSRKKQLLPEVIHALD